MLPHVLLVLVEALRVLFSGTTVIDTWNQNHLLGVVAKECGMVEDDK